MDGSKIDGDCAASMDEVELINNDVSSTDMCRLSDSQLVGMDGSFSTVYRSVADDIFGLACVGGDYTSFSRVADSSVGCSDTSLLGDISHSLRLESNHSVEETANRVFRLGYNYVLFRLKKIGHLFGVK